MSVCECLGYGYETCVCVCVVNCERESAFVESVSVCKRVFECFYESVSVYVYEVRECVCVRVCSCVRESESSCESVCVCSV